MQDRNHWQAMYLGAVAALKIRNVAVVAELAELTRSDEEAIQAISIMHGGSPGDRVWPARDWLQAQRRAQGSGACGEQIDVHALSHAADTLSQHACTIDAALEDDDHLASEATNVRIAIRRIIDGFRSAGTQEGS